MVTETDCDQSKEQDRKSAVPLTVPFTVAVDTREQTPFSFAGIRADACQRRRPLIVPLAQATLHQGDYSIEGCELDIAVERKSLADLFSTLSSGRKRFERELDRLNGHVGAPYVVIEADWHTILNEPPRHSQLNPKTIHRSVIAWQLRYPRVHWWALPGRRLAEITTFRLLERFWIERQRALKPTGS